MPSRKRRRKSKPTNPVPWLWLAFGASLTIGMLYSPLTRASVIRVEGALPQQHAEIEPILQSVRGIPSAQVSGSKIESRLLDLDSISRATYTQNLFGRGLLILKPRVGVAELEVPEGAPALLLDTEGTFFQGFAQSQQTLPLIRLPESLKTPTLSLGAGWESHRIAALCRTLGQELPEPRLAVEVTERGVISLLPVEGGATIILGAADGWEQKIRMLLGMLSREEDLFGRYEEVNLTVPSSPMVVPRGG